MTRRTAPSRTVAQVLQPVGQSAHTLGMSVISQGRAVKRYWVEVSAPTGHNSITLPEKRPRYGCSSNVAITEVAPRSRATSCSSWATSCEKRVQR